MESSMKRRRRSPEPAAAFHTRPTEEMTTEERRERDNALILAWKREEGWNTGCPPSSLEEIINMRNRLRLVQLELHETEGAQGHDHEEDPDCFYVACIPANYTAAEIRQKLEKYGPLRHFQEVNDGEMRYISCVYQEPSITDLVCHHFNGYGACDDEGLFVRRANGAPLPTIEQVHDLQRQHYKLLRRPGLYRSCILCLDGLVNSDDGEDHESIVEALKLEAKNLVG